MTNSIYPTIASFRLSPQTDGVTFGQGVIPLPHGWVAELYTYKVRRLRDTAYQLVIRRPDGSCSSNILLFSEEKINSYLAFTIDHGIPFDLEEMRLDEDA